MVSLMLLSQGCATTTESAVIFASSETSVSPDLGSLVEGDSVNFFGDGGVVSPLGKVVIGREYMAASGRLCKRILSEDGEELLSVICKASDERWYMRKLS